MNSIIDNRQTELEEWVKAYAARASVTAGEYVPVVKRDVKLVGFWAPAPQSGKSTAAEELAEHTFCSGAQDFLYQRVSFAAPMRVLIVGLCRLQGVDDDTIWAHMNDGALKEVPIPGVGRSFIELAIEVGTRLGRGFIGEACWVKPWERDVREWLSGSYLVLTDDVRFPNEAAAVRRLGGVMIGIHRPGATVSAARAAAEGKLSLDDMDAVVTNDVPLPIFKARVVAVARKLGVDV